MGAVAIPRETLRKLSAIEDPEIFAQEVRKMMGNKMPTVFLNRVLCAVYIEENVIRLNNGKVIHKTEDAVAESIWQGKPALVLAVGPAAFKDNVEKSFYGQTVKPGDWCTFKISNSTQIEFNKIPCRVVEDRFIETSFNDPRIVTS